MNNVFLIITSIANDKNPVLTKFGKETSLHGLDYIVIGDTKSPESFNLPGCDYYSIKRQQNLKFSLASTLPLKHYARKNLGYLIAISKGAEIIIETDDDNIPLESFWNTRNKEVSAFLIKNGGWVNVYKYFSKDHIWPRGFALEEIMNDLPVVDEKVLINCPIQQGLADDNPDVDAIYRLTLPLPITFNKSENTALGENSICPFNSQNTTWFKEAFPLLYLPSYCSFRMTDIWRSFIAQRIAWTCDWAILFHQSTLRQDRNEHNLMKDFQDEIPGYNNNKQIIESLKRLELKKGIENIPENMKICYQKLIDMELIGKEEMGLLENWLEDLVLK